MDKLSKEDCLALQNYELRSQLFDVRCKEINDEIARFRAEREAHATEMRKKYDLADGDSLNVDTGKITRAPKAEAEAEVKVEEPKIARKTKR